MEGLLGIQFKDFALVAADRSQAFSIILLKNDENKIFKLSENLVMAVSGESGDTVQFAEFIGKNIQLYKMRNGFELSPTCAANFIQRNLADYLRSRTPYNVNVLLAGYDPQEGHRLFYLDYLATMTQVPYAMHGYGGFFVTGLLDRWYRPDMTLDEGLDLLKRCIAEVQRRFIVNLPAFKVCLIRGKEITELPDIKVDLQALGLAPGEAVNPVTVSVPAS